MNAWFQSLEQREQAFVAAGALAVVVTIIYLLIWLPLDKNHDRLSDSVTVWQRSLAELQPLRGQVVVSPDGAPAVAGAGQAPVVIVDRSLRARGLDRSLQRSQPTTGDGIRVEFDNVAFDELVLWLGDLNAQYAMEVRAGTFSRPTRAEAGRINANLTLERAL